MKNRDFIKKSIEENIVNHTAVLNNLKAKAAVLEAERASRQAQRFGLKKAAVFAMLSVICVTCVLSSIFLFNGSSDYVPPVNYDISQIGSSEQSYGSQSAISSPVMENSESISNSNVGVSHEPKSEISCSGIINDLPLDDDTKAFFVSFSDNFTVLQDLINTRLDAGNTSDGYAKVLDGRFKTLNDIKNFLYSFMKPESAGEIYVGLTSGTIPYYKEKNGALYQRADIRDNYILQIDTETAFLINAEENTLIINAMLKTSGELDYYHRFVFEKINSEWLYIEVWKTPAMLTNNTNNK